MKRKAKYRAIPAWYDENTQELSGRNWVYDMLIEINIWLDFNVLLLDELPIWVEMDDLNDKS